MVLFNILVEYLAHSQLGSQLIIPGACFNYIHRIPAYDYLSTLTVSKAVCIHLIYSVHCIGWFRL